MNIDNRKIFKMLAILAAIVVIAGSLTRLAERNSMSLTEFVEQNGSAAPTGSPAPSPASASPDAGVPVSGMSPSPASPTPDTASTAVSSLTGASLNGNSMLSERVTYTDGFYFEPVSDNLRRYMTGVSLPADIIKYNADTADASAGDAAEGQNTSQTEFSVGELRYVHVWHYDFTGTPVEGELICNEYIAQDLLEIFYELYRNEYRLESVRLVDEYDGDIVSSMEANNTCCFAYYAAEEDSRLSRHALGLAVDVNPLYNPHISYEKDGSEIVSPSAALEYADRSKSFSYKIDENDLCCKLFLQHGFIWGGNRNDSKNYMHFQKSKP